MECTVPILVAHFLQDTPPSFFCRTRIQSTVLRFFPSVQAVDLSFSLIRETVSAFYGGDKQLQVGDQLHATI